MAVGKNVLENLTEGMYKNSFTVYREFIQNAADSIDAAVKNNLIESEEAFIDIKIEPDKRRIKVFDNACGISCDDFIKKMKDVADSDKDREKEKGFRGIGRLAGLGYCDRLIFRTSAKGEGCLSTIIWDGTKLRSIVNDPNQHPSSDELIEKITTISKSKEDKDSHFFEVEMENVIPGSDDLLDSSKVINYLSMVAPVPYNNSFIFSGKIKEFAKNNGFKIDEYKVMVNSNYVYKSYTNNLYEFSNDSKRTYDKIDDIAFQIFKDDEDKPIAWLWYGISKFEKNIPIKNQMRCIRLRKENIQIGGEETIGYPLFFREPRGNAYFVGELFAIDKNLIPNARRDYFNPTPATKQFEECLRSFFYKDLYDLYHFASKTRSACKTVSEALNIEVEFKNKTEEGFIDKNDRKNAEKKLEEERAKAQKAKRDFTNRKKEAEANEVYKRVFDAIEKDHAPKGIERDFVNDTSDSDNKKVKTKYIAQNLSEFTRKEQKLISKIYGIINKILPKDMSENLIKKIQEELSK